MPGLYVNILKSYKNNNNKEMWECDCTLLNPVDKLKCGFGKCNLPQEMVKFPANPYWICACTLKNDLINYKCKFGICVRPE